MTSQASVQVNGQDMNRCGREEENAQRKMQGVPKRKQPRIGAELRYAPNSPQMSMNGKSVYAKI